jgi:hypothetical protein
MRVPALHNHSQRRRVREVFMKRLLADDRPMTLPKLPNQVRSIVILIVRDNKKKEKLSCFCWVLVNLANPLFSNRCEFFMVRRDLTMTFGCMGGDPVKCHRCR